jgi:hypothetical protein
MKSWLSPSMLRALASTPECEHGRMESSLRSRGEAERRLGASQAEKDAALGPPADVASDLAEAGRVSRPDVHRRAVSGEVSREG